MGILIFVAKWTGAILFALATLVFIIVLEALMRVHTNMCGKAMDPATDYCTPYTDKSTLFDPRNREGR